MGKGLRIWVLAVLSLGAHAGAAEDTIRIAAAADFKPVLEELTVIYAQTHPTKFVITSGASGVLYAQIVAGAPFEVFFSADVARAEQLEKDRLAVSGSRFTYAIGKLVLWTPGRAVTTDLRQTLTSGNIRTLAIANPATAPYGAAAQQVLERLKLAGQFKLLRGESVAQTFQFLSTGNVDAGFVARSQIRDYERAEKRSLAGETLAVDATLHAPIEQQAIWLKAGEGNAAAGAFLKFVQSEPAQRLIASAGYQSPSWSSPDCHACRPEDSAAADQHQSPQRQVK